MHIVFYLIHEVTLKVDKTTHAHDDAEEQRKHAKMQMVFDATWIKKLRISKDFILNLFVLHIKMNKKNTINAISFQEAKKYLECDEPFAVPASQVVANYKIQLVDDLDTCTCHLKRKKCSDNAHCGIYLEKWH